MDVQTKLRPRAKRAGGFLVILVLATLFIPTPYTIQSPGPTFNTLEEVEIDGEPRQMVEIEDAPTYPTDGRLDMTTISVSGPPTSSSLLFVVLYHADHSSPSFTPAVFLFAPDTPG